MLLKISQPTLFPELFADPPVSEAASSTFVDNMRLPVHRWIRFSAGFSGAWAQSVIESAGSRGETRVFDPFSGSGTTLVVAEQLGRRWMGCELSAEYNGWAINRIESVRRTPIEEWIEFDRRNVARRESIR